MSGFFISFEGIDKSGKSTQAEKLVAHLQALGHEVVLTHEPGGTELGRELRHLALTWKPQGKVDATAEMFLFAADRAQHVAEVIRPALAANKVVITDRYVDSTLAYQGYGRALDIAQIQTIQHMVTGGLIPDLTVWVDVDLATSRARLEPGEADRMESEDDAWYARVRAGYQTLWKTSSGRILKVDGTRQINDIFQDIVAEVQLRMAKEQSTAEDV